MERLTHEQIMSRWYTEKSGPGSTLEFSKPYRTFIEQFIFKHQIQSVCDLGCGDGVIASAIQWQGADYFGVDCIAERVERNKKLYPLLQFAHFDLRGVEPAEDLVLMKDVIQHWKTSEIVEWLEHFTRWCPFKYALITNCNYGETVNLDIETGGWRAIDLTKPPFSVGKVVFSWGIPNKDVVLIEGPRS